MVTPRALEEATKLCFKNAPSFIADAECLLEPGHPDDIQKFIAGRPSYGGGTKQPEKRQPLTITGVPRMPRVRPVGVAGEGMSLLLELLLGDPLRPISSPVQLEGFNWTRPDLSIGRSSEKSRWRMGTHSLQAA